MKTTIRLATALVLVALLGSTVASAPGPWKTGRPEKARATLAKGKTLKSYPSADGKYALLVRDEGERGDFFWRSLYLKSGTTYALIGTYNEISRVSWSGQPLTVKFRGVKAVGPQTLQHSEAIYDPVKQTLRWRVLRESRTQPSG